MSFAILIITTVIAFAIHPVLGVIWLVAQFLGAFDNNDNNDDK